MITDKSSMGLLKIGTYKWIKKLYDGEISFSCCKAFITQVYETGNNEQGDEEEAIFSRLHKSNPKIDEMKTLLDKDLEIIDDGNYVKLRRKSSCLIPVFCIYSISLSDFKNQVNHLGKNKVKIDIPDKIYNNFISTSSAQNVLQNENRIASVFFQADPFLKSLRVNLYNKDFEYKIQKIDYVLKRKDEYFIEPSNKRNELFYKRPKYEYQHEARIILFNTNLSDQYERVNINIIPLANNERCLLDSPIFINLIVRAKRR